jgi:hypothetical protein
MKNVSNYILYYLGKHTHTHTQKCIDPTNILTGHKVESQVREVDLTVTYFIEQPLVLI